MKLDASIAKLGTRDVRARSSLDYPQTPGIFRQRLRTWSRCGSGRPALRLVLGLVVLFVAPQLVAGEAPTMTAYQARAVLVFKIAQFTEWPKESFESDNAPFVMGILGDDPFKAAISVIDGKTIKGRQLVVKHFSEPQEAAKCQLLFISSSEESRVPKIIKALENSSVMTVSEMDGFTERDGIVNLFQKETKGGMANLHFEINRAAAEKAKLKINSQLLSLASKK
jgi:hypothetical protein